MAYNSKLVILLFLVFGLSFGVSDRAMAVCPDGAIDGVEQCDPPDFGGNDCNSIPGGFDGGVLSCDAFCNFDTSNCCTRNNPTVTIAPASKSGFAGDIQTYTLDVKNNDSISCTNRTFALSLSGLTPCVPGWSDDLEINTGPLAGQATYIKNVDISSCVSSFPGTHAFTITATHTITGDSGNDSADYVITVLVTEICDVAGDEDGNGDFDCEDTACLGHAFCCGNGTKETIETCDSDADCGPSEVCSSCSTCVNTTRTIQCPIGFDDCDCNPLTGVDGCEVDVSSDPNNCGTCGVICVSGKCINGVCLEPLGGLVPCGRIADDPNTIWNEQEDCNICHLVILTNSITGYLLGVVGIITVLSLVIGGMLYVASSGNSNLVTTAKTAFRKSLYGFVIVFIAWVVTNTTMVLFGFDDPLGDGSWHKFDCEVSTVPANTPFCGDGFVDNPNFFGVNEVCDPKETLGTFQMRTGLTAKDWVESIYACDPTTCTHKCALDPLVGQIGEGCYNPIGGTGDPCQKGRYVCDIPSDTVICQNTFNDPNYRLAGDMCGDVYDYCCTGPPLPCPGPGPCPITSEELFDGKIGNAPFLIVKASVDDLEFGPATGVLGYADFNTGQWGVGWPLYGFGAKVGFRCDNVCKNVGKICVGVGFTDPSVNACVYVRHDESSVDASAAACNNAGRSIISMDLPANQASANCDAWFGMFYYSNRNGDGKHWATGYDEYVYYCVVNALESYRKGIGGYNVTPNNATCRPTAPDTCEFHGFDLTETACYCL